MIHFDRIAKFSEYEELRDKTGHDRAGHKLGTKLAAVALTGLVAFAGAKIAYNEYEGHKTGKALEAAPFGKHNFVRLGDTITRPDHTEVTLSDVETVVNAANLPYLSSADAVTIIDEQLKNRGFDLKKDLPSGTEIDLPVSAGIGKTVTTE